MRAWTLHCRIVAVVAISSTLLFSTGCRTGGGWGSVPGLSWMGWHRDKTDPTALADRDPTGQLPPPSAVAEPYSSGPGTATYGGAQTAYEGRSAVGGYPSTGYAGGRPPESPSYQTGPYKTGPVSTSGPRTATDSQLGSTQGLRDNYASPYQPGSGSKNLPADRWSRQTTYADSATSRETLPTSRIYGRDSAPYRPAAPDQVATNDRSYRDQPRAATTSDRGSRYSDPAGSTPAGYYGQLPDQPNGLSDPIASAREPRSRDLPADPYASSGEGLRIADRRGDSRYEPLPPRVPQSTSSVPRPERTSDSWRPGSTADYTRGTPSPAEHSPPPRPGYGSMTR